MTPDSFVGIYESEIDVIVDECEQYLDIETGGSLFGLWTQGGAPIICLATRPGPAAIRQATHFQQDVNVHNALQTLLWNSFRLQWIGLWHSHHHLGLHELSGGDLQRTMSIASRHGKERFTDILCYFTETRGPGRNVQTNMKPYLYTSASKAQTAPSRIEVISERSPFRERLPQHEHRLRLALQGATHRAHYRTHDSPLAPTGTFSEHGMREGMLPVQASASTLIDNSVRVKSAPTDALTPLEQVAAVLQSFVPSLPYALQESVEIEDLGGSIVQVDISSPDGETLRVHVDTAKDIVVRNGEIIRQSKHGRARNVPLDFLDNRKSSLKDYFLGAIRHLRE